MWLFYLFISPMWLFYLFGTIAIDDARSYGISRYGADLFLLQYSSPSTFSGCLLMLFFILYVYTSAFSCTEI